MNKLSYDLIVAAVNGDEAALKKIIQHYMPMIEKESGSNPLIRNHIIKGLREAILHYNLEDPAENDKYLQSRSPSQD